MKTYQANKMSVTAQKYVNIYTEANPNPASLKFAANYMLAPEGTDFDYPTPASALSSPLAVALFGFEFVERVFIMSNFVTVTKTKDSEDWYVLAPAVKNFIKEYLEADKPIFNPEAFANDNRLPVEGEDQTVTLIKNVLDEYVRPAVEGDGGAISFSKFEEGTVTVELRGSCSGCPSSTLTLKSGIENILKRMVPEVREVVALNL